MKEKRLISIVIPVYNEEDCIDTLYKRLMPVLDGLGSAFEVLFVNDGSKDSTFEKLQAFHKQRPDNIRVVDLARNYGQYIAIMAGFEHARGDIVVNLDADLQNPPEEIPQLIKKIDEGHDLVSSYRAFRHDNFYRKYVSRFVNYVRERLTSIKMRDHGCMLRAYRRDLVDKMVRYSSTSSTFVTALAYSLSKNPTEVPVQHEARAEGESKYNLYQLARLSFDLFTGFSLTPLHMFTMFGMAVSALSGVFVIYLLGRRLIIGPEAEGVFTLFAILYFLISVAITGIGLLGEYLGRTSQAVQQRPRFIVRDIVEKTESVDLVKKA